VGRGTSRNIRGATSRYSILVRLGLGEKSEGPDRGNSVDYSSESSALDVQRPVSHFSIAELRIKGSPSRPLKHSFAAPNLFAALGYGSGTASSFCLACFTRTRKTRRSIGVRGRVGLNQKMTKAPMAKLIALGLAKRIYARGGAVFSHRERSQVAQALQGGGRRSWLGPAQAG
jgi:hypothetical protein